MLMRAYVLAITTGLASVSNAWPQSEQVSVQGNAGQTWCSYANSKGKTIVETQCRLLFQQFEHCDDTTLDGSYVLIFSKESVAQVSSTCEGRDTVNGLAALFDTERVNGRTFYKATLNGGEVFQFESASTAGKNELAPWSPEWLAASGVLGQCYYQPSDGTPPIECTKTEVCETGGESGEGGCDWKFQSGKKTLYSLTQSEENYMAYGEVEVPQKSIATLGDTTCYPTRTSQKFCFSKPMDSVPLPTPSPVSDTAVGGEQFTGEIFVGSIMFGGDNSAFLEFLDRNAQQIIYLDSAMGYDLGTGETVGFDEKCNKVYEITAGKEGSSYDRTDEWITLGLSIRSEGNLDCGGMLQADLRRAATGVAGTGTGLYNFPISGFFQISRLGRWNDMVPTYKLVGIDAGYETHAYAKRAASALKSAKQN